MLHDVRDISHGEPKVLEFEWELVRLQAFVVNLLTTWDIRRFKKPIEEYTGPGLRLMDDDRSPLDAFPPPRYASLFQDVPLKASRSQELSIRAGVSRQSTKTEASNNGKPIHSFRYPIIRERMPRASCEVSCRGLFEGP